MAGSPTLRLERRLLSAGATTVVGMDEVGRGALCGPVTVGAVVVNGDVRALTGVRDSKLLSPSARADLVPRIRTWAVASAVGHAQAWEIDERGITGALRLAGLRALEVLGMVPDVVLLDGSHDWLSEPSQPSLLDEAAGDCVPPVVTRVKADLTCTSVAAASILAKTTRDAIMIDLHEQYPAYEWNENKGYAAPGHVAALEAHGVTPVHRRSWRLPGVTGAGEGSSTG